MKDEKEKKETKVEPEKLGPAATVLLSIVAALGIIVLARIMYFFITGA